MKLLLVTGRFPQRSETFIYRKAVSLARRGHDVTVASRIAGDWHLYPAPLPPSLSVEVWPPDHGLRQPSRWIAVARGMRRALGSPAHVGTLIDHVRRDARSIVDVATRTLRYLPFVDRRFDIVHFEFLSLASMYPLAAQLTGVPIVLSCRGTEVHTLDQRPAAEQAPMLDALTRADAIHCVSEELATTVTRLTGRTEQVWVNRPALDLEHFKPVEPRPVARPLRIITTGRLVWQKGLDHLLAALAIVARNGIDFRVEILGDGTLYKSLRFSIGDLGLSDRVDLVGAVTSDEAIQRMRGADVFVLSSHTEGISNAVIEAMALGLPIISTSAGGMAEVITDGVEGLLTPVRDVGALATAIARLARDDRSRVAMAHAARLRAERNHSLDGQAARFEELYTTLHRARPR